MYSRPSPQKKSERGGAAVHRLHIFKGIRLLSRLTWGGLKKLPKLPNMWSNFTPHIKRITLSTKCCTVRSQFNEYCNERRKVGIVAYSMSKYMYASSRSTQKFIYCRFQLPLQHHASLACHCSEGVCLMGKMIGFPRLKYFKHFISQWRRPWCKHALATSKENELKDNLLGTSKKEKRLKKRRIR